MSSREYRDDRGYKVVYKSRVRKANPVEEQQQLSRGDYDYDSHSVYSRDDRGEVSISDRSVRSRDGPRYAPDPAPFRPSGETKTTYEVVRHGDSDAYVKRSNVVVLGQPRDYGRSDYEILRPERRDDGAYVVETDRGGPWDVVDRNGYDIPRARPHYYDVPPAQSRAYRAPDPVLSSPRQGTRARSGSLVGSMQAVQVMEETEDDPGYRRRGRTPEAYADGGLPGKRRRSSIRGRNDHSPDSLTRRRSRSVGFWREQIRHHDVSESRHERPGAEAAIAGQYLRRHADYDDFDYNADDRTGYSPQRADGRSYNDDYEDASRHSYSSHHERRRDYRYPPQRDDRRRYDDDDDQSSYSEYTTEQRKTTRYYR